MNHESGIPAIVFGCIVIIVGFSFKRFKAATPNFSSSGRTVPKWMGRVLFLIVGMMFILAGLLKLGGY